MNRVPFNQSMQFGPRAEFYLKVKDEIVRADKVLPKDDGLPTDGWRAIIDYVQHGLTSCRANTGNNIHYYVINQLLPKLRQKASISLTGRAGLRAANGTFEIHPYGGGYYQDSNAMFEREDVRLVPLLDSVLGVFWAALDGKPRALSHSWKDGVLTYSTLSNSWFRSYHLMSLTFGLARWCCLAVVASKDDVDYVTPIMTLVPRATAKKVIEKGDSVSARALWHRIEGELASSMDAQFGNYPFSIDMLPAFHHFLDRGLDHWFSHDITEHWRTLPEGHGRGWETFLSTTVVDDMKAAQKA